jgi:hypothetical protein
VVVDYEWGIDHSEFITRTMIEDAYETAQEGN